jgi:hypothetical protein
VKLEPKSSATERSIHPLTLATNGAKKSLKDLSVGARQKRTDQGASVMPEDEMKSVCVEEALILFGKLPNIKAPVCGMAA